MRKHDIEVLVIHIRYNIKGLYISGSLRRNEEIINDIDYITKRPLDEVREDFINYYNPYINIIKNGKDYMSIIFKCDDINIKIDIWHANNDYEYKFLKWMRNMDKGHNIYWRKLAKEKGLSLSDRGLKNNNGQYINIDTLSDLKEYLLK